MQASHSWAGSLRREPIPPGLTAAMVAVGALLVPLSITAARAEVRRAGPPPTRACVVIDNDYDIDDMMAIPLVLAARPVAAIVQTEGFSRPGQAAAAIDPLIHGSGAAGGAGRIPILVGGSPTPEPDLGPWPWLPFYRAMMARSNGFLAQAPAPWPADADYRRSLQRAVAGCQRISVLITGPFTSFVRYSPLIRDRIDQVVVSGRPLDERPGSTVRAGFNCAYDLNACRQAMGQLRGLHPSFVVVPNAADCRPGPRPPHHCYTPDRAMVLGRLDGSGQRRGGLLDQGLPGRLKRALVNDTPCDALMTSPGMRGHPCSSLATWDPTAAGRGPGDLVLFWDLAAALRLLHPPLFVSVGPPGTGGAAGRHEEPALLNGSHRQTLERLRHTWTSATNQAVTWQPGRWLPQQPSQEPPPLAIPRSGGQDR